MTTYQKSWNIYYFCNIHMSFKVKFILQMKFIPKNMDHSHVYDEKVPNPYYYFIAACLPQQMIYCCRFAAESQNDQYNQV